MCVLSGLRTARYVLITMPDEVARNGALQRITSARGFLGRPDCISAQPSPRLCRTYGLSLAALPEALSQY